MAGEPIYHHIDTNKDFVSHASVICRWNDSVSVTKPSKIAGFTNQEACFLKEKSPVRQKTESH